MKNCVIATLQKRRGGAVSTSPRPRDLLAMCVTLTGEFDILLVVFEKNSWPSGNTGERSPATIRANSVTHSTPVTSPPATTILYSQKPSLTK